MRWNAKVIGTRVVALRPLHEDDLNRWRDCEDCGESAVFEMKELEIDDEGGLLRLSPDSWYWCGECETGL